MSILSRPFLLCLVLLGATNSLVPASAGVVSRSFIGDAMPVVLSADVTPVSAQTCTVSVTIQVNQVGDSIQIGCDQPSLINSPSSSWPYVYAYGSGTSTTRTFNFTTNSVSQNTTVHVYACPTGVDSSVSSNWSVSATITLPESGPMLALSQFSLRNSSGYPTAGRSGGIAALSNDLPALVRLRETRGLPTDRTHGLKPERGDVGRSTAYIGSHPSVMVSTLGARVDVRTGGLG